MFFHSRTLLCNYIIIVVYARRFDTDELHHIGFSVCRARCTRNAPPISKQCTTSSHFHPSWPSQPSLQTHPPRYLYVKTLRHRVAITLVRADRSHGKTLAYRCIRHYDCASARVCNIIMCVYCECCCCFFVL